MLPGRNANKARLGAKEWEAHIGPRTTVICVLGNM